MKRRYFIILLCLVNVAAMWAYPKASNGKADGDAIADRNAVKEKENQSQVARMILTQNTPYKNQKWRKERSFPQDYIELGRDEGYYITSLSYIKSWVVVLSKGTGYADQEYTLSSSFPYDFIEAWKEEDYYITEIAYGNDLWAVVMTEGIEYTGSQVYYWENSFSEEEAEEFRDMGYRITEIAYGEFSWVVVMTKGVGSNGIQYCLSQSKNFPEDDATIAIRNDDYITSLAHGDNQWLVVVDSDTDYTNQTYFSWGGENRESLLRRTDWFRDYWNADYRVTDVDGY